MQTGVSKETVVSNELNLSRNRFYRNNVQGAIKSWRSNLSKSEDKKKWSLFLITWHLSAVLFVIGILGVLLRRNALVMFMSLELMFNAGNLAFVTFARMYGEPDRAVGRVLRHDGRSRRGGDWPGVDGGNFPHQAQHRYG